MRRRKLTTTKPPEFNLYAGFELAPPLDWPELRKIMEERVHLLRKMTFRRIDEMQALARTQPCTTVPLIKVARQSGSLVLLPFIDDDGYKSVMFQLVDGDMNEGPLPVPDGQHQLSSSRWRMN